MPTRDFKSGSSLAASLNTHHEAAFRDAPGIKVENRTHPAA